MMIGIGRYRVYFTRYPWIQTHVPTIVKRFLFMTICIETEARPTDDDKVKQFPLGTKMVFEGRKYYYCRAKSDIKEGSMVTEYEVEKRKERGRSDGKAGRRKSI